MRILFFADNFSPETNAQASRVYERARYWAEWGHDVTVVTCAPNFPGGAVYEGYTNAWRKSEEIAGIRVVRVKTFIAANEGTLLRMADYLSFLPAAIWAGIQEQAPDVVAATSPQMFAALAGWAVARVKRRPFVLEVSDLWPESVLAVGAMRKPNAVIRGLDRMAQFLYDRADRIIVLTQGFKEKIADRGIAREKLEVILNGVELAIYKRQARDAELARHIGLQPGQFVVGYIGTLGMAHGLENVLDAAEQLRGTRVQFVLVGPGAEREKLRAAARERGLQNVLFVAPQPKQEMPRYWSLCDVALVHLKNTPLFETVIPSKIFEAMGMGLPIVLAAPKGEASKIVEAEGVGVHVPAGDTENLVRILISLSQSAEYVSAMAYRSESMAPRHSREEQARKYLAVLRDSCAGELARPMKVCQTISFERTPAVRPESIIESTEGGEKALIIQ
jgi:glycosyltransferase involved in cell wall biosynthesis